MLGGKERSTQKRERNKSPVSTLGGLPNQEALSFLLQAPESCLPLILPILLGQAQLYAGLTSSLGANL